MASFCLFWRRICVLALLSTMGLAGIGCNVFDGLQPEPTGVEPLLTDADVALANGHPQRAVRLLERAFDQDSTHVGVRTELANALYAAQDVDFLSVRRAVEQVNGSGATGDAPARNTNCTGGRALGDRPGPFVSVPLQESTALGRIAASPELFSRAHRLVVEGVLQKRADALEDVPTSRRLKAYLLGALTGMGQRLHLLYTRLQETESMLYVSENGTSSPSIVACGETRIARIPVERALCRLDQGTQQATAWLKTRNDLAGSEQTSLLISLLEAHAAALGSRPVCDSSSRSSSSMPRLQTPPVE